jgi:hypothetical protein
MNRIDQGGDMIGRGGWKDSMAKVKNVARPIPDTIKNPLDILLDQIHRAE